MYSYKEGNMTNLYNMPKSKTKSLFFYRWSLTRLKVPSSYDIYKEKSIEKNVYPNPRRY